MAKFGLLCIAVGLISLILPWLGFELKFENFLGTARPWIALGVAAFGTLLLYAGVRSGN
jgi:hypothetical protein